MNAVTQNPPSPRGHAVGETLEATGVASYATDTERLIGYRIGEELGEVGERVTWLVSYGVVMQGGRKIARRMVTYEAGGRRFLAQRCEPENGEPWYTVGALRPCSGCGEEMLTLAGSWRPDRPDAAVLDASAVPTGEVAHVGCR